MKNRIFIILTLIVLLCVATICVGCANADSLPQGIEIITQPTKLNYTVGETFEANGLVIKIKYDNGEYGEAIAVNELTFSAVDMNAAGEKKVTVSYTINGTAYQATYTINVNEVPHSHVYEWQYDETNHWKACECGEKREQAAHTYGGRDATNSIRCTVCGYKSAYKCLEVPTVGKALFINDYSLRNSAIIGFNLINNDSTKLLETYSLSFKAKFGEDTEYLYEIDLSNQNMIKSGVYNHKGKVYTEYYVVLEDYFVYCATENAVPTAEVSLTADFDDLLGNRTITLAGDISMPTLESRMAESATYNEAESLDICVSYLSRGFELPTDSELHEIIADYSNRSAGYYSFYADVGVDYVEEIQIWLVDIYLTKEEDFIEGSDDVELAEGLAQGYTLNIGCEKERNVFKQYYTLAISLSPEFKTECLEGFTNKYEGSEGLYNKIIEGAETEEEKILALIENSPNSIVVDTLSETILNLTPLMIVDGIGEARRKSFFDFVSNYRDEMELESSATDCYIEWMKLHVREYFDDPLNKEEPPAKNP